MGFGLCLVCLYIGCFFWSMFFISSAIFSGLSRLYFKMFGSSKDVNKYILIARSSKGQGGILGKESHW